MINVLDNVSAHIHLPRMFLPTSYFYEKRIGQITPDLLYMRFTYYTKDNQQGWLSLV